MYRNIGSQVRSVVIASAPWGAAAVWLAVALLVADPEDAMSFDFDELARKFLTGYERLFLPLLLLTDILIVIGILEDADVKKKVGGGGLTWIICAGAVYLIVAGMLPQFNHNWLALSWEAMAVALLCLWVARSSSYVKSVSYEVLVPKPN